MTSTLTPAYDARPAPSTAAVPDARRSRRPGWRNPRLVLGLVLVASAVLAGARVVSAADDTVPVWAAATALPAGAEVGAAELERRDVRFPDAQTARAYLSATDPLPDGARVDRPVAAGDLLPRSALAQAAGQQVVEVPVSVAVDDLPATVRQGSVVDVWVTPDPAAGAAAGDATADGLAQQVLTGVEVVSVAGDQEALAPQGSRQVIVGVPEDRADELARALGLLASGRVVVARTG